MKSGRNTIQLLNSIALTSAVVAIVICILVIANYIQMKRVDPFGTPAMTVLLERLKSDPGNDTLRIGIRELDLLKRKAFFTSRWQIRTGGYIMLACVLLFIICIKWIELIRPKIPPLPGPVREHYWIERSIRRRWIVYTGIFLVTGSLALAWMTWNEIDKPGGLMPENESAPIMEVQAPIMVDTHAGVPDTTPPPVVNETAVVAVQGTLDRQEWPSHQDIISNSASFRGPYGNGVVSGNDYPVTWDGTTGLNIKWKTAIPLTGNNSPIVWRERIFLSGATTARREIYCYDASDGRILWQTDVSAIQGSPSATPKVDRQTGLAAPTMTTDGHRVYAIFASGDLVALDMEGKLVWNRNLGVPKNHYGHSSSLVMYRNLLIVQWDQSESASVKAFDGATGNLVWDTPRDVKVSWASPILINTGNRTELILAADPCVASYDPMTGKELWKIDCIYGEVGPSPAYADGFIFATNEYAKLSAIKLGDTPQIAWESTDYLSDIPSPVANGKYLFHVTSYGVLTCYDAGTGEEYWAMEFGNSVYSSPVLVNDRIYLLDKKGIMHIMEADRTYRPAGEPVLGEETVCTPAFAGGRIYIRGEQNLYCIGIQ